MSSLRGKVIAITGAASGLGRAVALSLSRLGAVLALADLNEEGLKETRDIISENRDENVLLSVVDVTDSDKVDEWIGIVIARFGALDGAANVAGIFIPKPLLETTQRDWNMMVGVNLLGAYNSIRSEIKHMKGGASIVTVSSAAGVRGLASAPVYSASKHAVVGLCKSVAAEYRDKNIRCNVVAPGLIDTVMVQQFIPHKTGTQTQSDATTSLDRAAQPEEVASIITFLLSSDASFVTGACWCADGGYTV